MQLDVIHETRYEYAAPVSLAHHLTHLRPLSDRHQQLLAYDLDITPQPGYRRDAIDATGNAEGHFSLAVPHRRLRVRATSRVQVEARFDELDAESSPPWEALAQRLRYAARLPGVTGDGLVPEVEFALPSPYVPRLTALRRFALLSFTPGRPLAAAAIDLMQRIHTQFAYKSRSTQIGTPLAEVWERQRGVCQDFSHVMAGAMRMLGLPARYVSGYLLTHSPAGSAMQGADASHAWVQAWCPGTQGVPADGWLDLDPTNSLVPGSGHVRVAVGRDFGDVTPLRGVIRGGGGRHTMTVAVSTRVATPLLMKDANP